MRSARKGPKIQISCPCKVGCVSNFDLKFILVNYFHGGNNSTKFHQNRTTLAIKWLFLFGYCQLQTATWFESYAFAISHHCYECVYSQIDNEVLLILARLVFESKPLYRGVSRAGWLTARHKIPSAMNCTHHFDNMQI